MEYIIGTLLALAVSIFATVIGLDRDRAFYPTVTIVVASYYGLFAVMGGSHEALAAETVVIAGFILLAALGFRFNLWLLVAALAGHGVFDFFHGQRWAEFKYFDVLRLHCRPKRSEIHRARAGCVVVTRGEMRVVNVKTRKPVRQ